MKARRLKLEKNAVELAYRPGRSERPGRFLQCAPKTLRAFGFLILDWEGAAPAQPQTSKCMIFHAAQQELRLPENQDNLKKRKPWETPMLAYTVFGNPLDCTISVLLR